ncbi:MAG: CBS domain-containing protein [Candidatus Omnitrophica bacterium]|nr:CBS domain-containing protein [Candidatus Omnitrophota bacterium]
MELIITHSNLDFDGLSSLVAAKKLYPKAQAVLPSSLEKSVREFILFYGEELDLIRESECSLSEVSRLIIVETRLRSRLGKFSELTDKPNMEIHLYDHHPRTPEDIRAKEDTSKNVGATSTILIELVKKRDIKISPFEATVLSFGIYEDTGFFSFPTTTKLDLEMAGFLLSKGADINTISRYLKRAITEEDLNILSQLLNSIKLHSVYGVNIGIVMYKYQKYIEDLGSIANKLVDILDMEGIFIIAKINSKVQFTARSRSPHLDVNRIMRQFDGGGHTTAASAFIKEENLENLRDKLLKALEKHLKPKIFASDIMSYPIKTVNVKEKIQQAKAIMDLYDIEGLPVMEKGKPVGMITKSDVRKARARGFLHSIVKGYMSRLVSVKSDTPLYQIKDTMLKLNSNRVLVLKENRLIGIITRSDLLKERFKDLSKRTPSNNKEIKLHNRHLDIKSVRNSIQRFGISNEVKNKILKNLPKSIVNRIQLLGRLSERYNYNSFLIGGFVRDLLLEVKNYDLDVVVEPVCRTGRKDAIGFARIFADKVKGALVVYEKFGTATVIMKDKSKVDFATAREEFYEYPAALPTVEFGTIKQDLYRRDFTINAMAIRINRENFGELLDFFGGLSDLKKKKIRVLHRLSFIDDPTRVFRAVRFEQRYNFKIEPYTESLIKNAIEFEMFERISKQRLREELILILSEENPIKAIRRMADLNELRFIYPSISFNKKIAGILSSVKESIRWFERSFRKRNLDKWLIYFMALLEDLTKRQLNEVIAKFVFKKGDSKRLISAKIYSDRVVQRFSSRKEFKPSEIFKLLEELSYETMVFIVAKSDLNERVTDRVSKFLREYNGTRLNITGKDLKEMGLKPGPEFKKILKRVLYAKLDKGLNTKAEELDYLRKYCLVNIKSNC